MTYETSIYHKYHFAGVETVDELLEEYQVLIDYISSCKNAGMTFTMENMDMGLLGITTEDSELAEKYGLTELEEYDDEDFECSCEEDTEACDCSEICKCSESNQNE